MRIPLNLITNECCEGRLCHSLYLIQWPTSRAVSMDMLWCGLRLITGRGIRMNRCNDGLIRFDSFNRSRSRSLEHERTKKNIFELYHHMGSNPSWHPRPKKSGARFQIENQNDNAKHKTLMTSIINDWLRRAASRDDYSLFESIVSFQNPIRQVFNNEGCWLQLIS